MVKVLPEPVTPISTWCLLPALQPVDQGRDGLRLIAGGLEGGDELEHFPILPVSRLADYAGGMR